MKVVVEGGRDPLVPDALLQGHQPEQVGALLAAFLDEVADRGCADEVGGAQPPCEAGLHARRGAGNSIGLGGNEEKQGRDKGREHGRGRAAMRK
jgi:hypothetical protein